MYKMDKKGYTQGEMKPNVDNYQLPASDFSQSQFGNTLSYIERQDRIQKSESGTIKKQGYKGRYS